MEHDTLQTQQIGQGLPQTAAKKQHQNVQDQTHNIKVNDKQASFTLPKTEQEQDQGNEPKSQEGFVSDEQIPDHFYDSDLASINQKDFLSDNEPPKDIVQQRKLLYKQKLLHVFKTIIRLGTLIDKPARYDRIKLRYKQVPEEQVKPRPITIKEKTKKDNKEEAVEKTSNKEENFDREQISDSKEKGQKSENTTEVYSYPHYFSTFFLMNSELLEYNLGREHLDIERLVTSMKRGEAAVFELQHLEVSKKSNIKRRVKVEVFVIWVQDWTTVIDVDCDGKYMKQVLRKGEGHSRIAKHDEVSFEFSLKQGGRVVLQEKYDQPVKLQDDFFAKKPNILWKMMHSMKTKQIVKVLLDDVTLRQLEGDKYQQLQGTKEVNQMQKLDQKVEVSQQKDKQSNWELFVQIFYFHSIDDVFLDGRLLKKTLVRGVSTAKPDSASLVYYALRFYSTSGELLFEDKCFSSDWWQDFDKLQLLHCRKSYLDDQSVSLMLKQTIKRMKPAQIADIQCRDRDLFTYGSDYVEYKQLTQCEAIPEIVKLGIRVYNFTEGKNCFNMELEDKVHEARRKKAIAVKYLQRGQIQRALKTFENIVAYFSSGKINQQAYDQKVSALMNCTLCHLKMQNYLQMVKLCDQILELPRHGYDPNKLKIKGPGQAKIEGKLPEQPNSQDEREQVDLNQNPKIMDKCCYRKALGLVRMGEGQKALEFLSRICLKTQEVAALQREALKAKENYEKKSVKMYKNMFG